MRRLAAIATLSTLAACEAEPPVRPQWTVTIASDARLPQFGDRLRVELLDDEGELACEGCRRVFGLVDSSSLPLSFARGWISRCRSSSNDQRP